MSNMSYVRFENTSRDLQDCIDEVQQQVDDPSECGNISADELDAAKRLAAQCVELLALIIENAGKMGETLDLQHPQAGERAGEMIAKVYAEARAQREGK